MKYFEPFHLINLSCSNPYSWQFLSHATNKNFLLDHKYLKSILHFLRNAVNNLQD